MMNTVARRCLIRPALVARACTTTQLPWMPCLARRTLSTQEKPHMEREILGGLNAEELSGLNQQVQFGNKPSETHGLNAEQIMVLDQMFGRKLENLEAEVRLLRQRMKELDPAFAVDGPDGDSLGHELEEKLQVDHIIEEAAAHEDTKHVEQVHKLEEDVKKFHARDPEHDW